MIQTPVVVVGAGPVGLVAALELSYLGVPCVLSDKEPSSTLFPKMDITNGRSMELLRACGLAKHLLDGCGPSPDDPFDVIFTTRIGAERLSIWEYPSWNEAYEKIRRINDGTMALEPHKRISQIEAEAVLRAQARADRNIRFLEGWEFLSLDQNSSGVVCQFRDIQTDESLAISSAYVIGCDGASSRVRKCVDIKLKGEGVPLDMYMVHFRSTDPKLHHYGKFWHLVFEKGGAIISQNGEDIWTCHGLPAPGMDAAKIDPIAFVEDITGVFIELEVLVHGKWRASEVIAEEYYRNRVILAGDSAHQVFPAGGYGMNTGIGDAVGVGWAVAAIVKGWGGKRLLDAYQAERQEQGENILKYSHHHLQVWIDWWERVSGVNAPRLGEQGSDARRREADKYLQERRGENEYYGVEMGYRYHRSPVICYDDGDEPEWDPRRYIPTTWPGSRPPSVILADGSALFDKFGKEFTLVDFTAGARPSAFLKAFEDIGAQIEWVQVSEARVRKLWERDYVLIRPDQHVAWRGNALPEEPDEVANRVSGRI